MASIEIPHVSHNLVPQGTSIIQAMGIVMVIVMVMVMVMAMMGVCGKLLSP